MFRNNIKIALRNLLKQKLFSAINIFGLAIGLAGSLLITVFVWNELSYESVHENADDIYRIAVQFGKSDESMIMAGAMPALGPAAKSELPEVEEFTRIVLDRAAPIILGDQKFDEKKFFFADGSILDVFNIDILKKVDNSPLSDPFDILLSQSIAEKYFGEREPIGQTLRYRDQTLKITGVYEDIRGNTQIKPELIASYKTKEIVFPSSNEWGNFGQDITYLLLNTNMSAKQLEERLTTLLVKNTSEQFGEMIRIVPEHFPDVYLNSIAIGDLINHGNKSYVYLFTTVALFVLIIASLNFINLSTARSFRRSREVGIKKVLGAQRKSLIFQFLAEALVLTFIALFLGILLFEFFYPILTGYLEVQIGFEYLKTFEFYLIIVGVFLTVGLLSGLYPAFYLTRFNPIKTVKNEVESKPGGVGFRKVLVVSQFAISILLIFGTIVIYQQLDYMKSYDIGLDRDNVVIVNYSPKAENADIRYETLKTKLLASNDIKNVSGVYTLPGLSSVEKQTLRLKDTPESDQKVMRFNGVDFSFLQTFGLELIAGRDFDKSFSTDQKEAVIINETAVKEFGMNNEEIVGKQVIIPGANNEQSLVTVIGVVKDFNVESLHKGIEPVVLYINPQRFYAVAIKIAPNVSSTALSYIVDTWENVIPNEDFSYSFLDDKYNALYSTEDKIFQVFTIFSLLAIYIAALGLLGLTSFTAEQRRKEIGIRKVLGSNVIGIVRLLSMEYLRLIIISSVIALPFSYYLLNKWLSDFAYRAAISWIPFAAALVLVATVSFVTISSQAFRAASANPIDSIKYE
ncbi:MAG: ABC transporter permease [Melioribacteraceae bacterium]|nr:ABC transporter permease [Melioribacteraceae bacterium]MCF8263712.1 ABC transporter permease [Melioribacteraceae bacterium]